MSQLSGLYCTENKKQYRELLAVYMQKMEWKSVRSMWVMNQTSLYENLFHYLSPVEIMLISQFAIGQLPLVLNEVSVAQISIMNKHVAALPDMQEPMEQACQNQSNENEDENIDIYNSDYEDDIDYTDDPTEERLGPQKTFIPLKNIELVAELNDFAANVNITHTYVNNSNNTMEGVFLFPKADPNDQKIGVCGFEANVDGQKIVGNLMEKEKASQLKATLTKNGEGSYLFESTGDTYSFAIGTILPGQQVEIKISYVQTMSCDENGAVVLNISKQMMFPMTSDGECPCELPGNTEGLRSNVIVKMQSKISQIELGTDDAQLTETSRTNQTANLTIDHYAFLNDLILRIQMEEPNQPAVSCESGNDDCAVLLTYVPSASMRLETAQIIFITDVTNESQRMSLNRILSTTLENLPGTCSFNVIELLSDCNRYLFPEPRLIAGENIHNLLELQTTPEWRYRDILDICHTINSQSQDIPVRIIYIGAGYLNNVVDICQLFNKANNIRFFAMSMGYLNDNIKTLVKAGRGTYASATSDLEAMEQTIKTFCQKMLNPVYTLKEIDWGLQLYQQSPLLDNIIFGGELLSVTGFFCRSDIQSGVPVTIKITDQLGHEICNQIPLFPRNSRTNSIHTLAAQRWVQEHEDQMQLDKEVKNLALKYNLVSKYTSFLSYQKQHEGGGFNLQVKHVPVQFRKREKIVIYDVYMAGSGLGIFERPACLQIHDSSTMNNDKDGFQNHLERDICESDTISTPLGIKAYRCPIANSEFSHVFKGPQADVEGHNCWLNATLALLFSSDIVVNHLLAVQLNDGSILSDLSLLFKVWSQQDELDKENFRRYFNFMYGRIWFHLQHLGFTYGEDFGVHSAISTILPLMLDGADSIRIAFNEEDILQMSDVEEVILLRQNNIDLATINPVISEQFFVQSFISFQSLAQTSEGRSINHLSTVFPTKSGGIFVYDDILKFGNSDYQGGFVPYPNVEDWEHLTQQIPVLLLKKASHSAIGRQRVSDLDLNQIDVLRTCVDSSDQVDFSNAGVLPLNSSTCRWTLLEALQILRWIRFASQYGVVKGYNTFDVPHDSMIQKSETKLRMLIKQELEYILLSSRPVECFYKIGKLGLFESIFSLPFEQLCDEPSIDLMQGIKEMKRVVDTESCGGGNCPQQLMAAFLSCFASLSYEHKVKRKRRTIPVAYHLLSACLLCSKKEIEQVMSSNKFTP